MNAGPYARELSPSEIAAGDHRRMIGGMWDAVGRLQLDHLVANGLQPSMTVLDLGCGALRAGVHLVEHLEPGRYHGLDRNASLLAAGYDVELARVGLQHKLPRPQLIADADFDVARFGRAFDVVLAHSLFTHLPLPDVQRCLTAVAGVLVPGGRLFATFYEAPPGHPPDRPFTQVPGGIVTWRDRNPFHVEATTLAACVDALPLRVLGWGPWGHPRAQRMMTFERV